MSLYTEHYLKHHGVKGQKWGVRRFQYKDGSLTPEGEKRYNDGSKSERKEAKKALKAANKVASAYKSAGEALGQADYYRSKGDEAAQKHVNDEKILRKAAKQYDKEGKVLRAEYARADEERQKRVAELDTEWNRIHNQ